MIIYYLDDTYNGNKFFIDDNYNLDDGDKNQNITNISLTFKGIIVESVEDDDMVFFITGTLYEKNEKIT